MKIVVRIALRVFFRRVDILDAKQLVGHGPLLVVANHPNTFMDPISIASFLPQQVSFLAKASAFSSPLMAKVFALFNMIPIYRQQDAKPGMDAKAGNDQTFQKCFSFLGEKGTLLIFPEGTSVNERKLRPMKTGTARIALEGEALHGFKLGIKILPIGLHYSNAPRFQSDLILQVGQPIEVSRFSDMYAQDPHQAVQELTEEMRLALEACTVHSPDATHERLAKQIEEIYKPELIQGTPSPDMAFWASKKISEAITYFQSKQPERTEMLSMRLDRYLTHLNRLGLQDYMLTEPKQRQRLFPRLLLSLTGMLIGFPIYLFGLLHNYLPYRLPSAIANLLTKDIEFRAPVMMMSGILTFSGMYAVWAVLFVQSFGICWPLLAYLFMLPATGAFTWVYWLKGSSLRENAWLFSLFFNKKQLMASLLNERLLITKELEAFRLQYLEQTTVN